MTYSLDTGSIYFSERLTDVHHGILYAFELNTPDKTRNITYISPEIC